MERHRVKCRNPTDPQRKHAERDHEQEEKQEKNTKNATSQDEGAEKDQATASNPTKT